MDDEIISPLSSTARPVTWNWCPFIVSTTSPFLKSHIKTRVSIPPDTIPPSGKRSPGAIQASGPTKLECPARVFDRTNRCFLSESGAQNLTVLSLEDVANPESPQIQIPRTWSRIRSNQTKNLEVWSWKPYKVLPWTEFGWSSLDRISVIEDMITRKPWKQGDGSG